MPLATADSTIDQELEGFRTQLANAQKVFARQSQKIEALELEADEAGLARDKALYWLFRLCDAAEREGWPMSADAKECLEHSLNLLFDHNIYTGLSEPDVTILRLMEIVTPDLEADEEEGGM